MRLIGNKTRLVGEIERFLRDRGVRKGTFLDVFCGTASVARHFKALGFRVVANDRLSACFTKAVAEVEVSRYPDFAAARSALSGQLSIGRRREIQDSLATQATFPFILRGSSPGRKLRSDPGPLREVVHILNRGLSPREGIVFRNFSPGGARGGRYFTEENARRIDGILQWIRDAYRGGLLERHELHLLLSALIDAADRVANISGTYGAYLKSWQPNARQPLELIAPTVVESPLEHEAFQEDGNELVRKVQADVVYIDPPYTRRQYPANYHILEIIAEHHRVDDLHAYEASLYGKTGLRPYDDLRSLYCIPFSPRAQGANVLTAMADLVLASRARHVLISYNEEGLLSRQDLEAILRLYSGHTFRLRGGMRTVAYRRFCSDSDRVAGHARGKRQYKVLDGKGRNEISEWLLLASRPFRTAARRDKGRRARRRAT